MADPDSRKAPPTDYSTNKVVRPGMETAKPPVKPKLLIPGEGTSAKFIKRGQANTTGAKTAYPYETVAAAERREGREAEAEAEFLRKMAMRDSVISTEERYKMRALKKRIQKLGITI